jgi:hypothetical protein
MVFQNGSVEAAQGALLTEIAVTTARRSVEEAVRRMLLAVGGKTLSVMYRVILREGGEKGGT